VVARGELRGEKQLDSNHLCLRPQSRDWRSVITHGHIRWSSKKKGGGGLVPRLSKLEIMESGFVPVRRMKFLRPTVGVLHDRIVLLACSRKFCDEIH
jgi:hypothetical protein